MEVRIRTAVGYAFAAHLGEVALNSEALGPVIRLLESWGVRDGDGRRYGTGDLTGEIVYEDGAAFFEIVLCDEEEE